jgi:hypothetical protein
MISSSMNSENSFIPSDKYREKNTNQVNSNADFLADALMSSDSIRFFKYLFISSEL